MPKHLFRRYLPDKQKLKQYKSLRLFGELLHNQNLWHLNRYSVSWAFAVGLFSAFLPIPFQMAVAAVLALIVKANLPLSVSLVWLTNPITMPPVFYFTYKVGAYLMQRPPLGIKFELSLEWINTQLHHIWQPLLLGSLVCGILSGLIGFVTVRVLWRIWTARAWKRRKLLRRKKAKQD